MRINVSGEHVGTTEFYSTTWSHRRNNYLKQTFTSSVEREQKHEQVKVLLQTSDF